ncbi:MAG TPA: hypothetical protein VN672_09150 [Solirubrobacteraceae bacterium]|nr:hypothetical protein [Solirubrobacteraceae bacterium]
MRQDVTSQATERPLLILGADSPKSSWMRGRLTDAAERRGIRVVTVLGTGLAAIEHLLAGTDAIAVCAAPREQALVASVASGQDIPVSCIPAGGEDLLARDVGNPLDDPAAALDHLFSPEERPFDFGEVNGTMFVNYVALGNDLVLPPAMADSGRRWATVVRHPSARRLRYGDPACSSDAAAGTPTRVLVMNNRFALGPDGLGLRGWADTGLLGIAVRRTPDDARPGAAEHTWDEYSCSDFELAAAAPVSAIVDGSNLPLHPPLRFRCVSRALRVRVGGARTARGQPPPRRLADR